MEILSPNPEQIKDWRKSLVMALCEVDDKQVRHDLSEILLAVLPSEN